jgi:excisionase family DNA binding protein
MSNQELHPNRNQNQSATAEHTNDAGPATATAARRVADLSIHPSVALVPEMPAAEYAALRSDIEARGILVPIEITSAHAVVDGRHRLRAAGDLGLSEVPARVVDPGDEVTYILSAAIYRRHLTASQRAALALELSDYRERLQLGRNRQRANLHQSDDADVATLPPRGERVCEYAAAMAGVSPRLAQDAITVKEHDPDLFQHVKAGELPLNKAARRVRQRRLRDNAASPPPLPHGPFGLIYADPPLELPQPGHRLGTRKPLPNTPPRRHQIAPRPSGRRRRPLPVGNRLPTPTSPRSHRRLGIPLRHRSHMGKAINRARLMAALPTRITPNRRPRQRTTTRTRAALQLPHPSTTPPPLPQTRRGIRPARARLPTRRQARTLRPRNTTTPLDCLGKRARHMSPPADDFDILLARLAKQIAERVCGRLVAHQEVANTNSSPWMGIEKAAIYLDWPKQRLYKLTASGEIPHYKQEGRLLFRSDELDRWLAHYAEGDRPARSVIRPTEVLSPSMTTRAGSREAQTG